MNQTIDVRAVVVNAALGHTWVREIGANRGQAVEAILAHVHLPAGNPWCAAFIRYVGWLVLREQWPLAAVGGCASLGEDAVKKGLLTSTPAVAAVFLLWSEAKQRYHHTGFCVAPAVGGAWLTAEGNTSPDGSPEGTGVFARSRTFGPKDRFIHWWAPINPPLAAKAA